MQPKMKTGQKPQTQTRLDWRREITRFTHAQIGPEGRTMREAAVRVKTHSPIAADLPLPVPLFAPENPEGFRPDS